MREESRCLCGHRHKEHAPPPEPCVPQLPRSLTAYLTESIVLSPFRVSAPPHPQRRRAASLCRQGGAREEAGSEDRMPDRQVQGEAWPPLCPRPVRGQPPPTTRCARTQCSGFFFLVAEGSWILRCRCKASCAAPGAPHPRAEGLREPANPPSRPARSTKGWTMILQTGRAARAAAAASCSTARGCVIALIPGPATRRGFAQRW